MLQNRNHLRHLHLYAVKSCRCVDCESRCLYIKGAFNVVEASLPAMKARQGRGPRLISVGCLWLCCLFWEQVWDSRFSTITPTKFIAYDIHVTLVFPPDTDTLGLRKNRRAGLRSLP
ncbi:hypothetical protein Rs2_16770 [Raphanus sativus]|uniref:3-dehydrosphinganine reductase TSC10A-like n=1 Tax=Raphanus sativus TaxID=3726 RepID=A0A9W3DJ42_RAPSA|nr:3-dehydrosphinganine reductase TSC10A-like [Raphanus sativus]KAJ4902819.1 hypothetical protein Rs2_16770 [Raphanus sativus]